MIIICPSIDRYMPYCMPKMNIEWTKMEIPVLMLTPHNQFYDNTVYR